MRLRSHASDKQNNCEDDHGGPPQNRDARTSSKRSPVTPVANLGKECGDGVAHDQEKDGGLDVGIDNFLMTEGQC
jgi:hypothetical protein